LDFYDFDARPYDPTLMRFTVPDPLAEKYYSVSPYAYCGDNPVNRTDPTGMIWDDESLEEANELKVNLGNKRDELNAKSVNHQKMIESGTLTDDEVKAYTNEISAFKAMASNLDQSIKDIDKLGDDDQHTYTLNSNKDTKEGYVSKETDGKISITGNDESLTVHEITHVRQSLDAGKLRFDKVTNKLQYTSQRAEIQTKEEVEAYQKQFSVHRSDLNTGLNLRSPNEITPKMVGNMKRANGTFMYPAIHRFVIDR